MLSHVKSNWPTCPPLKAAENTRNPCNLDIFPTIILASCAYISGFQFFPPVSKRFTIIMKRALLFFVIVDLHFRCSNALTCPSPFRIIAGICLHFPGARLTWCEAQAYCYSVGGELIRGNTFLPLNGKVTSGMPSPYWIGLTDLLSERWKNKSGWRWTDGSLDPQTSGLVWLSSEPSSFIDDCICQCQVGSGLLCDVSCMLRLIPMCQMRSESNAAGDRGRIYQRTSILVGLSSVEYGKISGCMTVLSKVSSRIECAMHCNREKSKGWCVSFYFNKGNAECRLLLYTDSNTDMGDGQGWEKFVHLK